MRKRKQNVVSIKEKVEIIDKRENCESFGKLEKIYNIGVQSVQDIVKSKNKLQEYISNTNRFSSVDLKNR